ncbi:MAG: redoxin domain-containing protein [Myxococcota bacterium]|nr:redoxin domain-containing protein [Myxococcota bacterium]
MFSVGDTPPSVERQPVFGLPVRLPDPERTQLVVFVRSLSSPLTREALFQLQARHGDFDVEGVQVVAISDSDLELARDFVPRHHLLYPLITDPEQALFEAWGVGGAKPLSGRLRGLGVASIRGAVRALRHGHGPIERRQLRLPAQLVLKGGRVVHAHYGAHVGELPDLDALLAACLS